MMAIGGAGWLRLPGRLWWRVSCGQDTDFDEVVGEDAMSAPGSGAVDAGEVGAVPSVASLEVVDSSFGLRGQQQRDQAQAAVRRITGELADIAEAAMREAAAVVRNAQRALRTTTGSRSLDAMERARRPAERRRSRTRVRVALLDKRSTPAESPVLR